MGTSNRRFPEFPAGDGGRFKADIKVSDAVVKERLDIRAPFSKYKGRLEDNKSNKPLRYLKALV